MKLRTKLVFAELPLAVVLVAVAVYALGRIVDLSAKADAILSDNYRSVIAMQRIESAVDEADAVVLSSFRDGVAPAGSSGEVLARFESELVVQEHNITEKGEKEATEDLRSASTAWERCVRDTLALQPRERRWDAYWTTLRPLAVTVKKHTARVLDLNQDAMVEKATSAGKFSKEVVQTLSYVSLGALALVIAIGFVLSDQIARPLVRLAQSARQIAEGDLDVQLEAASGGGELETLVTEFGRMAEKLKSYRRSSLGELLEATEAAQAAIDSLVDPVLAFNEDGSFRRANEAARRILGLDPNARDPIAGLAPEVRSGIARVRDQVLKGKGPQAARGFENALAVLVDGRPCYFQPVATPIRTETAGTVVGVTVLLRDVTSLRRADELKNDLLSTVAHEIRTPLTSIRMALHLCLERAVGALSDKQDEVLCAARDDAERLHNLVEGILSVSKIEAGALVGRRRAASPRELVESAATPFRIHAADRGVTLEASAPESPAVAVDVDSVVLVLTNMLSNALKHTSRGGQISVVARPDGDGVRFEVTDTGSGISPEHQPRLFEKFYRVPGSPPGGSGLGLSIARDVVFAHEGEIGIESEVGQGEPLLVQAASRSAERVHRGRLIFARVIHDGGQRRGAELAEDAQRRLEETARNAPFSATSLRARRLCVDLS